MTELSTEQIRLAIVEHTRRLAEAAAAAGPGAGVPTAPGWTVTELVEHVGQTQDWVAQIVERRITDPARLPTEVAVLPTDPGEWAAWLSATARRVVAACSDDALDAPVFNAAGDERSGTRFWLTSVLNESVVHGVDAALAARKSASLGANESTDHAASESADHAADESADHVMGKSASRPVDIEPAVAAALISNHFAMLTSPTWAAQRSESARALRGTGQTLQWRATDTGDGPGAWFVERQPDGATWQAAATRPADVTVTGPAGLLLLILTRRLPLQGVDGDAALAQHWLDHSAHIAD